MEVMKSVTFTITTKSINKSTLWIQLWIQLCSALVFNFTITDICATVIYTFIGIFVIIDNFLKSDLLKGGHSMNVAKKYFWPQHQAKGGQRAA